MGEIITTEDLEKWLKVSRMTIYRWRKKGMPHMQQGGVVRYDKDKVQAWLERQNKN